MSGAAGLLRVPRPGEILGSVVACGLDQQQRARVLDAFRSRVGLRFLDSVAEITDALRSSLEGIDVVVLPAVDRPGSAGTIERVARQIAAERPRVAIVAYCPPGARFSADIRALAAAGVHQFVFAGIDDQGTSFRAVLAQARRGCAADWVMQQLRPIVPPRLHRLLEAILTHPDRVTSIPTLAAEL